MKDRTGITAAWDESSLKVLRLVRISRTDDQTGGVIITTEEKLTFREELDFYTTEKM